MRKEVADAIVSIVERILGNSKYSIPKMYLGKAVAAEASVVSGADLWQVSIGDQTLRYVPAVKGASISVGDILVMLKAPGTPMVIIDGLDYDANDL